MPPSCRICGERTREHGTGLLFGHREIGFWICPTCGFVQTDDPDWLAEAYASPFTRTDIGFFRRAVEWTFATANLAMLRTDPHGRHLDYGAGLGLFVRAMRDAGFDFVGCDRYADCALCRPWTVDAAALDAGRYGLVTLMEVIEHVPDPAALLDRLVPRAQAILLGTVLLPHPAPRPGTWDYYGLEHGQHVSFFSRRSLEALAARYGWRVSSDGRGLHLLSPRPIAGPLFRLLTARFSSVPLMMLLRRRHGITSLTGPDVAFLRGEAARNSTPRG